MKIIYLLSKEGDLIWASPGLNDSGLNCQCPYDGMACSIKCPLFEIKEITDVDLETNCRKAGTYKAILHCGTGRTIELEK